MTHHTMAARSAAASVALASVFLLARSEMACAATYNVLYDFCSQESCNDGEKPVAPLLIDDSGNLFGTTSSGGAFGYGTVFELVHNSGGSWTESVLYSFCSRTNCSDGANPQGALIADTAGGLYGTAGEQIFQLAHARTGWKFHLLYTFCSKSSCEDGDSPYSGLSYAGQSAGKSYDQKSPLFGTTQYGGAQAQGVAFQLTRGARKWKEAVLYSFCSQGGSGCSDGKQPYAGLLAVGKKTLVGTTPEGGANGTGGTVFKISAEGKTWSETVLHSFCALSGCADGAEPYAGLLADSHGNFYGTTSYGGSDCSDGEYCGTVFRIAPDGTESVLHSFCSGSGCADGSGPFDALIMDGAGDLLGTAGYEGGGGNGTVFAMGQSFQVLYNFCSHSGCADGAVPFSSLTADASGNLYGTTRGGGAGSYSSGGVVFELTP